MVHELALLAPGAALKYIYSEYRAHTFQRELWNRASIGGFLDAILAKEGLFGECTNLLQHGGDLFVSILWPRMPLGLLGLGPGGAQEALTNTLLKKSGKPLDIVQDNQVLLQRLLQASYDTACEARRTIRACWEVAEVESPANC